MGNKVRCASSSQSTHLSNISLLRVIAMVSVVFYHCLCYYGIWTSKFVIEGYRDFDLFLVSINMPLFVFLSGYLYAYLRNNFNRYQDNKIFVFKKAKRLLIPYVFWGVLLVLFFPIPGHRWINFFSGICHLWFLLMLFEEFLFFHFTFKFWKNVTLRSALLKLIGLLLVSLLMNKMFSHYEVSHLPLCINQFFRMLPFFGLGTLLACAPPSGSKCIIFFNRYSNGLAIIFCCASLVLCFMDIPHGGTTISYILTIVILLSVFKWSESFSNQHISFVNKEWLKDLDKCSMGIYIIHHPLIECLVHIPGMDYYLNNYFYILPIVIFIFVLPLSWLIAHIMLSSRARILLG